jgi:hypothetical protein
MGLEVRVVADAGPSKIGAAVDTPIVSTHTTLTSSADRFMAGVPSHLQVRLDLGSIGPPTERVNRMVGRAARVSEP